MSCPRNGQLTHTKERTVRTAGKIQKSPTGCADRYSSNNCVPASVGAAFIGVQRGHPLPHFPLPLPLSLEGFPKGRAAARPFVPRGGMGDGGLHRYGITIPGPVGPPIVPFPRKRAASSATGGAWPAFPHVSGGGLRGRDLCAKDSFPLPCSGNYLLREQRGIISITRCNGNL